METKTCRTCGQTLPLDSFCARVKKSSGKTYYSTTCRSCDALATRRSRAAAAAQVATAPPKECAACQQTLPASAFYVYDPLCKPCRIADTRRYKHEHAERYREHSRAKRQRDKQRPLPTTPCRRCGAVDWYQVGVCRPCTKERSLTYGETHKERRAAIARRWAEKNREKVRAAWRRRYEREQQAPGACTPDQADLRLQVYEGLCWICQQAPAETMDHVIALINGGSHWPANLRPVCHSCNHSKSGWERTGKKSVPAILAWAANHRARRQRAA